MITRRKINKIIKENREYFDAFEHYDKTREWLIRKEKSISQK